MRREPLHRQDLRSARAFPFAASSSLAHLAEIQRILIGWTEYARVRIWPVCLSADVCTWPDAVLVQHLPSRQLLGVKRTRCAHRELFRV